MGTMKSYRDIFREGRNEHGQGIRTAFDLRGAHFVATTLVAGFTLAAGPVAADAIITDTNGLDAGEVSIPVSDGKIPGYRARPAGKTQHAGHARRAGSLRRA